MNSKPKNSFLKNVHLYFKEYCACSSVHGFQYFNENRTIFERIWWLTILIICAVGCTISIYTVYGKWESSPVIVHFANRATPIYKIPFPAITICPETKSKADKLNFTDILLKRQNNVTLEQSENINFEYTRMLCNPIPNLKHFNINFLSEDFFDVIDRLKPEFQIQNCTFMGDKQNCSLLFTPIMTDEGVCYSFNILNRSDIYKENVQHYQNYHLVKKSPVNWSLEGGYSQNAPVETYPQRALLSGAAFGLRFHIVTLKKDLDFSCKNSLQGYKVLAHSPTDVPRLKQKFFKVPLDQSVIGAIQPVMINTSDSVRSYDPKMRRCYFTNEYQLKYFKIYSLENCKMECFINRTLDWCRCVQYFMPRDNETKICGTISRNCWAYLDKWSQIFELYAKINKTKYKTFTNCDCFPVCSDLNYNVETSQTDWNWRESLHESKQFRNVKNVYLSSLVLFFKSDDFLAFERSVLYGPIDFLANFGGLLGLFSGFSLLSLMEMIYFLSVRIICNRRLYGHWAGKY